jgi:hypothetical protein
MFRYFVLLELLCAPKVAPEAILELLCVPDLPPERILGLLCVDNPLSELVQVLLCTRDLGPEPILELLWANDPPSEPILKLHRKNASLPELVRVQRWAIKSVIPGRGTSEPGIPLRSGGIPDSRFNNAYRREGRWAVFAALRLQNCFA